MTWNLFLDDERVPSDVTWAPWQIKELYRNESLVICRTRAQVREAVRARGMPKFISFDHDLGQDEPDGYFVTKMLCDIDDYAEGEATFSDDFDFYVHSKNPVGAKNIEVYLRNYLEHRK